MSTYKDKDFLVKVRQQANGSFKWHLRVGTEDERVSPVEFRTEPRARRAGYKEAETYINGLEQADS